MSGDTAVPLAGPFAEALAAADNGAFEEPWQAEAFALTVGLHAGGVFSWPEWSQTLAREIAECAERGTEDYFGCWLNALESLLTEKGVATRSELSELSAAWREAYRTTAHGQPVRLDRAATEPASQTRPVDSMDAGQLRPVQ